MCVKGHCPIGRKLTCIRFCVRYMQLDPVHVAMTNSHVIVTSEDRAGNATLETFIHLCLVRAVGRLCYSGAFRLQDVVYIWSYRTSVSRQAQA